jgi:hypothetical protein
MHYAQECSAHVASSTVSSLGICTHASHHIKAFFIDFCLSIHSPFDNSEKIQLHQFCKKGVGLLSDVRGKMFVNSEGTLNRLVG